ncbi:hypothetical protein NP493_1004g00026 [Ridgeia piscesae]|uniref:Uncharacterized protein n=1 Tax=Ridgeia piscesae TaxID=27915 RepID=A0AAD9KIN1_RIDPI|nr:hypothetical protein NP493_1004g00026 [Ridgeia piscesae]
MSVSSREHKVVAIQSIFRNNFCLYKTITEKSHLFQTNTTHTPKTLVNATFRLNITEEILPIQRDIRVAFRANFYMLITGVVASTTDHSTLHPLLSSEVMTFSTASYHRLMGSSKIVTTITTNKTLTI